MLLEYASIKGGCMPSLVLESAWRVPNWALMNDALQQVIRVILNIFCGSKGLGVA